MSVLFLPGMGGCVSHTNIIIPSIGDVFVTPLRTCPCLY